MIALTFSLFMTALFYEAKEDENEFTPRINEWNKTQKKSIHKLTISNQYQSLHFLKNTSGVWVMTKPEMIVANQPRMHQIISSILKMKVDRVLPMSKVYEDAVSKKGMRIECEFLEKKIDCVFFKMPLQKHHLFINFKNSPEVLKCVDDVDINTSIKLTEFWTKRVFPFTIDSLKLIIYKRAGQIVHFSKNEDDSWSSNIVPGEEWKLIFSNLDNAACIKYTDQITGGQLMGSYEFHFQSGRKSLLELKMLDELGYIVIYKGTKRGQMIDKETFDHYFPRL